MLGTTDATGLLNAALPYGTWQLSVTGHTALTTWPSLVLDPTAVTTPTRRSEHAVRLSRSLARAAPS